MNIYCVAKDSEGDIGYFLLYRLDGQLVWGWAGNNDRVKSDAPRLKRIIDADSYRTQEHPFRLFTPFLEEDLEGI